MGNGAWGMGHGAWGMGNWASGKQGKQGIGHWEFRAGAFRLQKPGF
ncbi:MULTISPECIES: hypothetical protein [unclassified Microcoleus]